MPNATPSHHPASDHTLTPDPTSSRRFHELDSLRGLAAFTVVLYHFVYLWAHSHAGWSLTHRLLTAAAEPFYGGPEAVMMFFVLSGFVLTLPYLQGKQQSYPTFLLRRVLRIGGPYLIALAIAVGALYLFQTRLANMEHIPPGWWQPPTAESIMEHVFLIGIVDTNSFNPAFWSLNPEMRISLIFPLLVWMVRKNPNAVSVMVAIFCSCIAVVIDAHDWFAPNSMNVYRSVHYVALFIIGILLANHLRDLQRMWDRMGRAARWAFAVVSVLLYTNDVRLMTLITKLQHRQERMGGLAMVADWMAALGSAGIIVVSLNSRPVSRFLNKAVPRFLGRVSYSLYLMHMVVLLTVYVAYRGQHFMWVQFAIYLVASLLMGWVFCMFVEEPFIRMGRALGRGSASKKQEAA